MRNRKQHITIPQRLVALTGMLCVCLLLAGSLHAQSNAAREYKVKAVFLFNFTQFVEWPASAFNSPTSPFVIGILGDDPFGNFIDETVSGEKIGGHQLIVQRYHELKDVKNCHILFINSNDPDRIKEFIATGPRTILTVSDADNFMKMGGMIRLFTESSKIRLQINPEAAKTADLSISSKLLRVADIFDPKSQQK